MPIDGFWGLLKQWKGRSVITDRNSCVFFLNWFFPLSHSLSFLLSDNLAPGKTYQKQLLPPILLYPTGLFAVLEPHNQEISKKNAVANLVQWWILKLHGCERVGQAHLYSGRNECWIRGNFEDWKRALVKERLPIFHGLLGLSIDMISPLGSLWKELIQ